jgi:uncharacterized membrane protein YphA (DoxX/SURF4 family)
MLIAGGRPNHALLNRLFQKALPLQEQGMTHSTTERSFILVFRLLMAWTFLYAASHQIFNPKFSAAAFLSQTKTFHNIYAVLTAPAIDPALTFLVSYGHLLILRFYSG